MAEVDAGLTDFDPFGGATLADPYPQFAHFVDQQPVFWSAELGYWVVSRYADARRVLREHETFSAANAPGAGHAAVPGRRHGRSADGGFRSIPTLTNVDPPAHTRTRRIAQMAFSPRRVAADGAVRARARAALHRRPARTTGTPRSCRRSRGSCPPSSCSRSSGCRAGDVAAVKQGAANRLLFMFGRASRGRAGRHRRPAWPRSGATARRSPTTVGPRRATRLHVGPRPHPRPGRHAAHPAGGRDDPVRAPARRARDDHQPPRQRAAPAARGPPSAGPPSSPIRRRSPAPSRRCCATTRRSSTGAGARRRRSRSAASSCPPAPTSWCASAPPTATRACSPEPDVFDIRRRQRPPAPVVRLRPAPLPRCAAGPAGGPGRARGARRRAARACACGPDQTLRVHADHRLPRTAPDPRRVGSTGTLKALRPAALYGRCRRRPVPGPQTRESHDPSDEARAHARTGARGRRAGGRVHIG